MKITVSTITGSSFCVDFPDKKSVLKLKKVISRLHGIPQHSQILTWQSKFLCDEDYVTNKMDSIFLSLELDHDSSSLSEEEKERPATASVLTKFKPNIPPRLKERPQTCKNRFK